MNNKTFVIYHKSDFDGIFCREIARKFLPTAVLIGWEYGEPEPSIPSEARLYILDLSVPGLMGHPNLTWIDHHKSAINTYPGGIQGYRIDGVAACRLAWQWFAVGEPLSPKEFYLDRKVDEPLAVRLAGEYDVWDKRDPRAELFQHGLRSQELNELVWFRLLDGKGEEVGDNMVHELLLQGNCVQFAKTQENKCAIESNGFTVEWEGLRFLCCNAQQYNSFLFTAGITPEHDALLGFCLRANRRWTVSLYGVPGKPDIDLSKIAVRHGGGGHKQACGFTCDSLPFLCLGR